MCGVVGLIGVPDAAREAFLALTTLQHRGQDAAGILSFDSEGFHQVKDLGLVESVFTRENVSRLSGNVAIGHARYSTAGKGSRLEVQPFLLSFPYGLGMVHNGNVVNAEQLASDLKSKSKRHLLTQSDTEIILNLLADALSRAPSVKTGKPQDSLDFEDLCFAVGEIFEKVNGSFSIVTLIADHGLLAFRDPNGIRPLIFGKKEVSPNQWAYGVVSESVALPFLGYQIERDLAPGELLFIDLKGNFYSRVLETRGGKKEHRPCMFEWVYFASPESEIDHTPVYASRIRLGKHLAACVKKRMLEVPIRPDVVVPVPETSRIAAIALSEELKLPYREVLIKNRYIKRTFILDSQEKRQKAVNLKLSPVRSEIEGRNILLVDDSIVRGTTSKKIVDLVRQAGAKEVYFVSTCPPILSPCYYGIDFPDASELIAAHRDLKAIEKELGADAVIFQSLEGLKESVNLGSKKFTPCMACLDKKYPTSIQFLGERFSELRAHQRNHPHFESQEKGSPL